MPDKKLNEVIDASILGEYQIDPTKIENLTRSDLNSISQALMEVGRRSLVEGKGVSVTMCCCVTV
jgi:hypothetical protein